IQYLLTRDLHVLQQHSVFAATKLLYHSTTFLIEQFAKVAKIDILIVHVRLTLPMYIQDYSFHLPVDSAIRVFKTFKQRLRKPVEGTGKTFDLTQIPGRHVD